MGKNDPNSLFVPIVVFAICIFGFVFLAYAKTGDITTVAGGGIGDGGPATQARFDLPFDITVDVEGNLYIADTGNNAIRKIDTTGTVTTIAGTREPGFSGDGGAATEAKLNFPFGLFVDRTGNIYVADTFNHRIRRIDTNGTIATVAGNGEEDFSGDGGRAVDASLNSPTDIILDSFGAILIADTKNERIRLVDTAGVISTVAGNGKEGFSGDGGPATEASLNNPISVFLDGTGNLFIADQGNSRIRKVDRSGFISTVAGNGRFEYSGDGGLATEASLAAPSDIYVDAANNLIITDSDNNRIRVVNQSGIIFTYAGSGFGGGFGLSPGATFLDYHGNLYIADTFNDRIRKVDTSGILSTVAGVGLKTFGGDGGLATGAMLNSPNAIFIDPTGSLYIADSFNDRIRKVDPSGIISTVAGDGFEEFGFSRFHGDGGPAVEASLNNPAGIFVDSNGCIYIADRFNIRIRKIDPSGIISTVAGNGEPGFSGDGGPATEASLWVPEGILLDDSGNLYIADSANNRIRKVDAFGTISTVAGNGEESFSGDGGPATEAALNTPKDIFLDNTGHLFIADMFNHRIRKIDPSGSISTVAGNGELGFSGDNGPATEARLFFPTGVYVDDSGNIYIADKTNDRVRKVDSSGTISTVAGNGEPGTSGDGGPAIDASLTEPSDVFLDKAGNLFIADPDNDRIRMVEGIGGNSEPGGDGGAGLTPQSGDGTGSIGIGDLDTKSLGNVQPGQQIEIQITFNQEIAASTGFGVELTFDPEKLSVVSGSRQGAFSGAIDLPPQEKEGTVTYGASFLGQSVTASGEVATITFEALEGFSGEMEIVLTEHSIKISGGSHDFTPGASVVLSSGSVGGAPTADFDGDGDVDFDDFFEFAAAFGQPATGAFSMFDLDQTGETIDFNDFFAFAAAFGTK